jgi:tetratricopeptide (TPR) repeat protein
MRQGLLFIAGTMIAIAAVVAGIRAVSNRAPAQPEAARSNPVTVAPRSTPADKQISAAQGLIERAPSEPRGYNLLADAHMQKARETGDFSFNAKAESALEQSLKVAPDNMDAIKLKAELLTVYHRFGEALEMARRAQAANPKDHEVYAPLTDALVELGDYEGAVRAAQTMVDLKPNTASYSRISYLRELHGDTEGAIEAMRAAAESASPINLESLAWCRVQLGNLLMNTGKLKEAEYEFDTALYYFPDYYPALAAKAHARTLAGDTDQAIKLYKRSLELVPLPDTAIALGDLYAKVGRADEARQQYDLAQFIEQAGASASGTYSRQLALFWADHDMKLDDALVIARRERAARSDIYTSDALAWCLYKKGELSEAKTSIEEALRLGTRDARLYYHAGMIYHGLGDRQNAKKYLKRAFEINPSFDLLQADIGRRTLDALSAAHETEREDDKRLGKASTSVPPAVAGG